MLIANATAELWLSDNESSHGTRLIAHVEVPGRRGRFAPLRLEQISAEIKLEKGKSYYVEVVHKQAVEDDHCAVGWVLPGKKSPEIIGGSALRAATVGGEAKDVEILPEDWLAANGLQAADAAKRGPHADPDGDGLTNLEEWRAGTHPLKHDVGGKVQVKNRLTCELWDGFPGKNIRDLARSGGFPGRPNRSSLVDELVFSDEGDSYGCRLRGFITAPEDGSYSFQLTGDRASLLYLAESQDKFTKRLVAETVDSPEMKKYFMAHQSEGIALEKGKKYYIEVLFKRDKRVSSRRPQGDRPSVTWKRPGKSWYNLIAAEYLTPYQPDNRDADDDGLPDDWEQAHGLNASDGGGDNGPWGDPDGDGLTNFREFQAGTDPSKANPIHGVPGYAQWEYWENIRSSSRRQTGLEALKSNAAFPLKPTERDWVIRLEGLPEFGEFYGSRLRAYVIPPVTGDYRFAIAGDNECELWLSDSDLKYYRTRIASVRLRTAFRDWFDPKEPKQMSSPVRLEAGKRYYIEALHHQGEDENYVSVAWKVPGKAEFEVIEGQALAGFDRDPNDGNDDDLPDDWSRENGISTTLPRQGDVDRYGNGLTNRERFLYLTRPGLGTNVAAAIIYSQEVALGQSKAAPETAFAFTPLTSTLRGDAYSASFGSWEKRDGQAWQTGRRGSVTYPLAVPRSGVHALKFTLSSRAGGDLDDAYDFRISFNGVPISYQTATIPANGKGSVAVLTPWLNAGETYQIEIFVDNSYNYRRVSVDEVSILAASGPDTNGNGIPEWVETWLRDKNGFDQRLISSRTSPAIVEGRARYTELAKAGDIVLNKAPNGRFFAEVPLAPGAPANLSFAFENGGLTQTANVHWQPTNLLRETSNAITIRQGDSLLLTAFGVEREADKETYTLTVNGETVSASADHPTPVPFPTVGTQVVEFSHRSADGPISSGRYTVTVLPRVALDSPLCVTDSHRLWTHSPLPAGAEIQFDNNVTNSPGRAANTYNLATSTPQNQPFLVRQGADGPILGSGEVKSVRLRSHDKAGNIYESIGDPISKARMYVVVTGDLDGAEIRCTIVIGGVTFDDGTTTKSLWVADFDDLGVGSLLFLKANTAHANCRKFSVWKDGVRVGAF